MQWQRVLRARYAPIVEMPIYHRELGGGEEVGGDTVCTQYQAFLRVDPLFIHCYGVPSLTCR